MSILDYELVHPSGDPENWLDSIESAMQALASAGVGYSIVHVSERGDLHEWEFTPEGIEHYVMGHEAYHRKLRGE